jgi:LysM repeat protein
MAAPPAYYLPPRRITPVSNRHTVVPGQTLQHVAMVHGVSADDIASHPRNVQHNLATQPLYPGTRLFIPR